MSSLGLFPHHVDNRNLNIMFCIARSKTAQMNMVNYPLYDLQNVLAELSEDGRNVQKAFVYADKYTFVKPFGEIAADKIVYMDCLRNTSENAYILNMASALMEKHAAESDEDTLNVLIMMLEQPLTNSEISLFIELQKEKTPNYRLILMKSQPTEWGRFEEYVNRNHGMICSFKEDDVKKVADYLRRETEDSADTDM